jgi:hypothetical protein
MKLKDTLDLDLEEVFLDETLKTTELAAQNFRSHTIQIEVPHTAILSGRGSAGAEDG